MASDPGDERRTQGAGCPWWPGKSGGARIIYYVVNRRGVIYLIDVYAKSAKEDLTDAEKREIRRLVAALEAET
jgi:mRNA-degrading endonuclease RelE of RelBE toxin-antitoxin system